MAKEQVGRVETGHVALDTKLLNSMCRAPHVTLAQLLSKPVLLLWQSVVHRESVDSSCGRNAYHPALPTYPSPPTAYIGMQPPLPVHLLIHWHAAGAAVAVAAELPTCLRSHPAVAHHRPQWHPLMPLTHTPRTYTQVTLQQLEGYLPGASHVAIQHGWLTTAHTSRPYTPSISNPKRTPQVELQLLEATCLRSRPGLAHHQWQPLIHARDTLTHMPSG